MEEGREGVGGQRDPLSPPPGEGGEEAWEEGGNMVFRNVSSLMCASHGTFESNN
jgi:hypothetical protein